MKENIELFTLPFAGGNSYSYNAYLSHLPSNVTLIPVEIPGRGKRSNERLIYDARLLAEDIFAFLKNRITSENKYAIFGHSMGALLGYLLIRKIIDNEMPAPVHFFASGRGGPSYIDKEENYHLLPKQDFLDKLKELGGSPEEVLEHDALMDFYEPILRADFQVVETYTHMEEKPFDIPVTILTGVKDKISFEAVKLWQKETISPIKVHQFNDGHFFIFQYVRDIANIIAATLTDALAFDQK